MNGRKGEEIEHGYVHHHRSSQQAPPSKPPVLSLVVFPSYHKLWTHYHFIIIAIFCLSPLWIEEVHSEASIAEWRWWLAKRSEWSCKKKDIKVNFSIKERRKERRKERKGERQKQCTKAKSGSISRQTNGGDAIYLHPWTSSIPVKDANSATKRHLNTARISWRGAKCGSMLESFRMVLVQSGVRTPAGDARVRELSVSSPHSSTVVPIFMLLCRSKCFWSCEPYLNNTKHGSHDDFIIIIDDIISACCYFLIEIVNKYCKKREISRFLFQIFVPDFCSSSSRGTTFQ